MAIFNFFRTPKPQQYRYIPRYWDPAKEDLEARLGRYKEDGDNVEAMKSRISANLRRRGRPDPRYRRRQTKQANIRLLIILVGLIVITWILFVRYGAVIASFLE
jgi:hypothetical protein